MSGKLVTMQDWFDAYGESHQNGVNKMFHWICVPVIFISLIGLLSLIPVPSVVKDLCVYIHPGSLLLAIGLIFYFRLSVTMGIGMLGVSVASLFIVQYINSGLEGVWMIYVGAFVLAWIGQFIGHKIEGAKPSFFDDLKFLLIGPGWLLSFIFQKVGITY
ncbi:MAG: DUF962 domain-containing protein [Flavobacteriales bacterium]|nr:DUF962 domain-containing protein [Flavobacteriales bacterium]